MGDRIAPLTSLPMTTAATIDGTTQPGFVAGGPRLIELSGINYDIPIRRNQLLAVLERLRPLLSTVTPRSGGWPVNRFSYGIAVGGSNNHIEGNYVGTDPTGSSGGSESKPLFIMVVFGSDNRLGTERGWHRRRSRAQHHLGRCERGTSILKTTTAWLRETTSAPTPPACMPLVTLDQ